MVAALTVALVQNPSVVVPLPSGASGRAGKRDMLGSETAARCACMAQEAAAFQGAVGKMLAVVAQVAGERTQ